MACWGDHMSVDSMVKTSVVQALVSYILHAVTLQSYIFHIQLQDTVNSVNMK